MSNHAVAESSAWGHEHIHLDELDHRIQRLEDAVAALCNTQETEERIRDRVLEQLKPELDSFRQQAAENHASAQPATETVPQRADITGNGLLSLFREISSDISLLIRMIRDPRYASSWLARMIPILPLGYLLWSWWIGFPRSIPFIGYLLDILIFTGIIYVFFKVVGRELRRYRDFLARRIN